MELKGTRFGDIQFENKDLLHMTDGLIGMPEQTEFLIMDFEEETPLKWMQSTQDASIGFLVADPLLFKQEYNLGLMRDELKDLDISSFENLVVFVICTLRGELKDMMGNLLGPIIVDIESRKGRQLLVEDSELSTHEPLYKKQVQESELKSSVCEKVG